MRNRLVLTLIIFLQTALTAALVGQEKKRSSKVPMQYTQDWPEGRGFDVGKTIPDIPLVDLEGNEVRFSKFLGKRYVLYCWASW